MSRWLFVLFLLPLLVLTGCGEDEKKMDALEKKVKELEAELDKAYKEIERLRAECEKSGVTKLFESVKNKSIELKDKASRYYSEEVLPELEKIRKKLSEQIDDFDSHSDKIVASIKEKLKQIEYASREVIRDAANSAIAQELKGKYESLSDDLVEYFSQIEAQRQLDLRQDRAAELAKKIAEIFMSTHSLSDAQTDKLNDRLATFFMQNLGKTPEKESIDQLRKDLLGFLSEEEADDVIALVSAVL